MYLFADLEKVQVFNETDLSAFLLNWSVNSKSKLPKPAANEQHSYTIHTAQKVSSKTIQKSVVERQGHLFQRFFKSLN